MTIFEWAINALRQNRAVKRHGWTFAIRLDGDRVVRTDTGERVMLFTPDLLARDWEAA